MKKYNWEGINVPSEKDDWKKFKKKNRAITVNVLYAKKEKYIYRAYVSKQNSNHEKQVILLMIPHGDGWDYPAVKKLSALLREITSKHHGDFYYLDYLHSFITENKHESHKKVCEKKDFCNIVMLFEDTQVLEFNQY